MSRQTSRVSLVDHIGDSPFSTIISTVLLLALLPADYYNLDLMLAGATNGQPWATHIIAATITVAMTLLIGYAASFVVKGARSHRLGWLLTGVALGLVWLASVVQLYWFRHENISSFDAGNSSAGANGVQIVGAPAPAATTSDHGLALTLTVLLLITGLIAAAIAVLREDPEQHTRRRLGRSLLLLRWRYRRARAVADRRNRLAQVQAEAIDGLSARHQSVAAQVTARAISLQERVRLTLAATLRDPAATTAVQASRP